MKKYILLTFLFLFSVSCKKETPKITSIFFEKEAYTIQVDKLIKLSVLHNPAELAAPTYQYELHSLNPSASLNGFSIDGIGGFYAALPGVIHVTARVKDNPQLSCSCVITVIPYVAESISLDKHNLDLLIGQSSTLSYTILPNNTTDKSTTWISSNTQVATVSSKGLVTAVGQGEATISVQTSNGHSDECVVTVSPIRVERLEISQKNIVAEEGDVIDIFASIFPSNASNQTIHWASSNENIAWVMANPNQDSMPNMFAYSIICNNIGKTTLTAMSEDGEFTQTCEVEVKLKGLYLSANSLTIPLQQVSESIRVYSKATNQAYTEVEWTNSSSAINITPHDIEENRLDIFPSSIGSSVIYAWDSKHEKSDYCIVTVKDITELIQVKFQTGNVSISADQVHFSISTHYENPTNMNVYVNYAMILDENNTVREFLMIGSYEKNICPNFELSHTFIGDTNLWRDKFAKWKIQYSINVNGQAYMIEQYGDRHNSGDACR